MEPFKYEGNQLLMRWTWNGINEKLVEVPKLDKIASCDCPVTIVIELNGMGVNAFIQ